MKTTLDAKEAAAMLGITVVALWTRVRKGEIPTTKPSETKKRGVGRPPVYGFDPEALEAIRDSLRVVGSPRRYPVADTNRLQMRGSESEIATWDAAAAAARLTREDWLRQVASEFLNVEVPVREIVASLQQPTSQFWLRVSPEESEPWMMESRRHRVSVADWFRALTSYGAATAGAS